LNRERKAAEELECYAGVDCVELQPALAVDPAHVGSSAASQLQQALDADTVDVRAMAQALTELEGAEMTAAALKATGVQRAVSCLPWPHQPLCPPRLTVSPCGCLAPCVRCRQESLQAQGVLERQDPTGVDRARLGADQGVERTAILRPNERASVQPSDVRRQTPVSRVGAAADRERELSFELSTQLQFLWWIDCPVHGLAFGRRLYL
jgi:hypothetical protein